MAVKRTGSVGSFRHGSEPVLALFRPPEFWSLRTITTVAQSTSATFAPAAKEYDQGNNYDDDRQKKKEGHYVTLLPAEQCRHPHR